LTYIYIYINETDPAAEVIQYSTKCNDKADILRMQARIPKEALGCSISIIFQHYLGDVEEIDDEIRRN
jgi:hypothetical protein